MWIDRNSWHWRLYQWWYERKFSRYDRAERGPLTLVNICPYVRTILFWAPIRWLTAWGPRKVNVAAETVGWMGAYWLLTIIPVETVKDFDALIVFTGLWLIGLVIRLFVFLGTHDVGLNLPSPPDFVIEKGASFFNLLGGYISKAHTQICPQIELRNGGQK